MRDFCRLGVFRVFVRSDNSRELEGSLGFVGFRIFRVDIIFIS